MTEPADPSFAVRIVRAGDGDPYEPPGHSGVDAWNLHGPAAGGPECFRLAASTYPPGASADLSVTGSDMVYVVTEGTLELDLDDVHPVATLAVGDSVFLPMGTTRAIRNQSTEDATILVVAATRTAAP